jgi:hypothetical protein
MSNIGRLIEENEAAQARVRDKLAKLGGPLKPLRNPLSRPKKNDPPQNQNARLPIDLKVADTAHAGWAARGVARALEACGFRARISNELDAAWDGFHVEGRADDAAAALLIQSAFRVAGLPAGLTIHDRAAAGRIVLHVGPDGMR